MKYILILIAIISIKASAQVDSSSYTLPFQMKQKFAKLLLPAEPKLEDSRYIDTLNKAIGSGSLLQADSVTTIVLKAGTYWKYIDAVFFEIEVADYAFASEFFEAPLVVNGYSGYIAALNYYKQFGTANQKIAANWSWNRLVERLAQKQAVLKEQQAKGLERLQKAKNPVYN